MARTTKDEDLPAALTIPRSCPVCASELKPFPFETETLMRAKGDETLNRYELVELEGTSYDCARCGTSVIACGLRFSDPAQLEFVELEEDPA